MPTITQLQYIVALDQEQHFGKAAEKCHVAQPSLSAQIQKLEEELDIIIFDRSKKPIMVTDAGRDLLEQAKIVLREHSKLRYIASLRHRQLRGDFHLAVIPTLAPYLIPIFLSAFSQKYPGVNLKINEYKTEDILRHLANDDLDAGILVSPIGDSALIERHLFFEPFYIYLSQDHPLAHRKLIGEKDLDDKNLWLLEEGHCFRDQVLKLCARDKKRQLFANVEFAGGNLETLKYLIQANTGYTLLPELAVSKLSEQEKSLHVRAFKKPVPTREVSIIHSRSFYKESFIGALEEIIIERLPKSIRSLKKQHIEVVDL